MNIFLFFFLIFISLPSFVSNASGASKIAVTVGGESLTKEYIEAKCQERRLVITNKPFSCEEVAKYEAAQLALSQKAKAEEAKGKINLQEEVKNLYANAQRSQDLIPLLSAIKITEKDIEEYYKKMPEYNTAQILIRVPVIGSPNHEQDKKAAQKIVQEVGMALRTNPKQFESLAVKYSQTMVATNGGNVGFQPAVRFPKEVFEAIHKGFSPSKPETIIGPIESAPGFYFIKILGKKLFKDIDRPLYEKILYDEKRDLIIADYQEKILKESKAQFLK